MTSRKIVTHCAPTLVGIKTANLFNEHYDNKEELIEEIKNFNKVFREYGINMIPLTLKDNRALIYVYRIKELQNDFNNYLSKELLNEYGYDSNDIYKSIKHLSGRMNDYVEFPHEIGLFLGYPPADVKGFIDNDGKNYKCMGYWKAYVDEEKAIEIFKKYHDCQKNLLNRLNMGFNLKQLVTKTIGGN